MTFKRLVMMAVLCLAPTVMAQTTDAAVPATVREIQGFRSALFGMKADAVLAAIRADFGVAPSSVERREMPEQQAVAFVVPLMRLNPGPLPATVVYLFDQPSGQLFHINVVWEIAGTPDDGHRHGLYVAQLRLLQYFATLPYTSARSTVGNTSGSGFSYVAEQPDGARVSVYIRGVRPWPTEPVSTNAETAATDDLASLMLSYSRPRATAPSALPR
jgi:hypothetical protein